MPILKTFKDATIIKTSNANYGSLKIIKVNNQNLPYSITAANGKSGIFFDDENPIITLMSAGKKTISLTKDGFLEDKKITAYSKKSYEDFSKKLGSDTYLQQSVFDVSKALWALPAIHSLHDKESLFDKNSSKQYAQFLLNQSQAYSKNSKGDKNEKCELKNVTETVAKTVTEWVNVVKTAAEQAMTCKQACDESFWDSDPRRYICYGGCGVDAFKAIITGTIKVVKEITETVINQVYICTPEPVKYYGNPFAIVKWVGSVTPRIIEGFKGIKAKDVVDKFDPGTLESIKCMIKGKWSITQMKDLNVEIPLVREAPFGLRLCIDNQCALKLKDNLISDLATGVPFKLFQILCVEGEAEKFFGEIGVNREFQGIFRTVTATGLVPVGFTTAAFAKLVLAAILLIFYHAAIIAGQIGLYTLSGQLTKGVCLHHPTVPLVVVSGALFQTGLLIPVAFGLLVHFPVIVTPQ